MKRSKKASPFEAVYLKHLALKEKPFGELPDPTFFFGSRSHSDALKALDDFAGRKTGIALVYGEAGVGKTLVRTLFVDALDKNRFDVGLIPSPPASSAALFSEIAGQFGISFPPRSDATWSASRVAEDLASRRSERLPVLVIDEAEALSNDALDTLVELVRESRGDAGSRLRIVLFGRAELVARLLDRGMEDIRRSIATTHCLLALSVSETGPYIMHRLSKAGSNDLVRFTQEALNGVHEASMGYPGRVDAICDQCLFLLQERSKTVVDEKVLKDALRSMGLPFPGRKGAGDPPAPKGKLRPKVILLVALAVFVILALLSLWLLGFRPFPG